MPSQLTQPAVACDCSAQSYVVENGRLIPAVAPLETRHSTATTAPPPCRCGSGLMRVRGYGPPPRSISVSAVTAPPPTCYGRAVAGTRIHLIIRGLVQGVSYRYSAREKALELGLTGWVKNLPSGEVEAVAEGDEGRVRAFVAWCHKGPSEARVESVREEPQAATGEFTSFAVTR
jgi:acylphosphatase